ncbi:helix-turn-helix transcriptional regulator [Actinospica sp.]|jgi:transcriptional regulator with XRE-family HTH domain|uniref:helix-turn-helix transcriptional regulator n=1 Tax=Actinospica sp. TaxID=1872142 RepID=UPI002B64C451|nr:helix-turn-helix transcriptional regulator [Actinospica sp.]HWG26092.1 helix-turn-helix transcriptional regulator [Actinospica sp.]
MPGETLVGGGNELGRFLRARREGTQPESVGLSGAGRRRVPGLRRDELAMLSGISSEYYVRLEQGRNQNPSTQVLEALARALRLDDEATAHLYRLSRPLPGPAPVPGGGVSPTLRGLLDASPTAPAFVTDRLNTVLAANALAQRLSPAYRPGANLLRVLFLDPDVKGLYRDWDAEAEALVAALGLAARAGGDPTLSRLVEDLSGESEAFRALWGRQDVRPRVDGTTVFDHPDAGTLELTFEKLAVLSAPGACPNTSGQYLTVFHAEPDSTSAGRLATLAEQHS